MIAKQQSVSQMTNSEIIKIIEAAKAQGKIVVATNGCFDILHLGHLKYLERSKALGDILVVGLNSDASVKKLKGESRPINSGTDRAALLLGLKPVDHVIIFDELDASEFLRMVKPNIYTKGADYQAESLPEYAASQEIGAKIELIELVDGKSTSSIIKKMHD
jgi:D-glycero-beta-D-manno-heptose 1-phosphate adenylyltransferase